MASAAACNPNNWLLDSGATRHLTTDLNNLALHQPYTGGEEVTIADGTGLPITHTGYALLPTPHRSLKLRDVLYVLNVKKILSRFIECAILMESLVNSFLHTFR